MLSDETFGHESGEPGHIAPRMRQALDQPECDRVGHIQENHRNRRSGGMDGDRGVARRGDDNFWAKREQLSQQRGDLLITAAKVAILDLKVLPYDIAALVQSLQPSLPQLGNLGARENCYTMNSLLSGGLKRK